MIGLAGWSGQDTLAEQLIGVLTERGRGVATIKHAHHRFDADAGQGQPSPPQRRRAPVLVPTAQWSVPSNTVLAAINVDDLLAALAPADIVLVEGFANRSRNRNLPRGCRQGTALAGG